MFLLLLRGQEIESKEAEAWGHVREVLGTGSGVSAQKWLGITSQWL